MFTSTKWEVERQLKQLPEDEQKSWLAGTYREDQERKQLADEEQRRLASEAQATSIEGYVPAASWGGARPGMVFKSTPSGLGYYPDHPPAAAKGSSFGPATRG